MRYLLLLLFIGISSVLVAQPCQPMPANIFRQKLNQLAMQQNDQQKLQFAKNLLQGSCFLSSQVKDMAMTFNGDYYRFEFAKRAWKKTFDPNNFFDVYDAFVSLSAAIRLYDHVTTSPAPAPPQHPGHAPWYPDLAYPGTGGYKGVSGCQMPVADHDFDMVAKPVISQPNDQLTRNEAMKLVAAHCISVAQAMKLASLFEMEANRLSFLKEIFPRLYDLENYSFVTEIFSHEPYKNDWIAYAQTVINPPTPAPPVVNCEVTAEDYEQIKKTIRNVSVNSTRLALAKQVISTKKCFTVNQIAGIMDLFSVESSRLEIALFSYDYCVNTTDYYRLSESLSTTSSRNALIEFINNKK